MGRNRLRMQGHFTSGQDEGVAHDDGAEKAPQQQASGNGDREKEVRVLSARAFHSQPGAVSWSLQRSERSV